MAPGVRIRPYASSDAPALYEAVRESIEHLRPWMGWCHADYTLAEAREWVDRHVALFAEKREHQFVVIDEDGALLGACGLNQVDSANRRANLGYWIRLSAAGRGCALAAVRLVAAWAWENTDLERLEIVVAVGNAASLRVAEKVGASREGVLAHRLLIRETFHDAVMFSLVRSTLQPGR